MYIWYFKNVCICIFGVKKCQLLLVGADCLILALLQRWHLPSQLEMCFASKLWLWVAYEGREKPKKQH